MRNQTRLVRLLVIIAFSGCGGGGGAEPTVGVPSFPPAPPPPTPGAGFSVLHTFSGGTDGALPYGLIGDGDGNLYGTTFIGGDINCLDSGDASGCGTIFRIDAGGVLTTLHAFAGGISDGAVPSAGLIRDEVGNIYGGTFGGGQFGFGVVYRLDPNGGMAVLHHFTGGPGGFAPNVSFMDAAGNLYGTSGINWSLTRCMMTCGTLFRIDAAGDLVTLHVFNGLDGDQPGHLVRDSAGRLLGTTAYGGPADCGHFLNCGTVFSLDPDGTLTTLHAFTGWTAGGEVPTGTLQLDDAGNLYGTTLAGGMNLGGTVYRLAANGQLSTLHAFVADFGDEDDHPNGQNPEGGVLLTAGGKLYGTTRSGGTMLWGTVFELDLTFGVLRLLHRFTPEVGGGPVGPLVMGGDGNLYGTGRVGGMNDCSPNPGCGIVFKIELTD